MKLNLDSWHAKWWLLNHQDLPHSLCPYFWGLILLLVKLPFTWMGYLVPDLRKREVFYEKEHANSRFVLTFLVYFLFLLGYSITSNFGYDDNGWLQTVAYTVLYVVAEISVLAVLVGIGIGLMTLKDYLEDRKYERRHNNWTNEPKQYIVKEWWKGFTGKYCPKIDWK